MIGRTVAHYRILEEIGRGGMGVVYRALDTKLDRTVALKFLPPQFTADAEARKRFEHEAKAAAAQNHPNIVTVYEIGEHQGQVFIAMEYVPGRTLKDLISAGADPRVRPDAGASVAGASDAGPHGHPPLPMDRTIAIAAQIADGLSAAHAAGVVHRDIKPQNILIDSRNRVRILDFGLAKLAGEAPPTGNESTWGTAGYMSPEQAMGRKADHRTDIWSLGVVLYQMLTGELPFRGENGQAVLRAIVTREPEPISRCRPDLPEACRKIVARCLQKNPSRRFIHAAELHQELLRLQRPGDLTEPLSSLRHSRFRPPRLRLGTAALLAGLLLATTALVLFRQRQSNRPGLPDPKHVAVLPLAVFGADADLRAFADGLAETMTSTLTRAGPTAGALWVVPASEVRAERVDDAASARRALGVNLAVTGSIQSREGILRLTINLVDTASRRQIRSAEITELATDILDLPDRVGAELVGMLEIKAALPRGPTSGAGGTREPQAFEEYLKGRGYLLRYEREENLEKAASLFRQALRRDPQFALAFAALAEADWRRYEITRDPEWAERAQADCRQAIGIDRGLADVYVTLGIVFCGRGRYPEAVAQLRHALRLDPLHADAVLHLAIAFEGLGRLAEAEATYKKAIEARPGHWAGYNNLGYFYFLHGPLAQAERMFCRVIELTPDNIRGYNNLGAVCLAAGRTEEARRLFQKSLAVRPNPDACSNLGTILFFQGRFREAAAQYEQGVALSGLDHQMWGNLADAYRQLPDRVDRAHEAYARAEALIRRAIAINPNDAHLRASRALYLIRSGASRSEALEQIAAARSLAADDLPVLYNSILVYELAGRRAQALDALRLYVKRGGPAGEMASDPDLKGLSRDPRFSANIREGKRIE